MSLKTPPSMEGNRNTVYQSVSTQCESKKSSEDSNVVLLKSWSDCEESDDEKKVHVSKKMRRNQNRELKRKKDQSSEQPSKKIKTEDHKTLNAVTVVKEEEEDDVKCSRDDSTKSESGLEKEEWLGKNSKSDVIDNAGKIMKCVPYNNLVKTESRSLENSDDRYNETTYYQECGLRKVYPYYFTFTTFTKGRWVGNKILDVFAREFRAHPAEEYKQCIEAGLITVNSEKVSVDYVLKHNDLLANVVHRHEVPVAACPIEVIYIDKNIVVVNKPASIPVHPCGRYRHNTIIFILGKEYNLKNLHTVHRLDRLTSGVLMFGRSVHKALEIEKQIRNRLVMKKYVCRVEGDFPFDEIECTEPIEVVSYKIGVCKVSSKGKDCSTTFQKIGYNSTTNTSVIRCMPHSGRMHQIRVHLQYLGYPVLRDPLYNHPVFGPEKGKGGQIAKTDEELIQDLITIHNAENWLGMDGDVMLPAPSNLSQLEYDSNSPCSDEFKVAVKTEYIPFQSVATQTNYEEPDPYFQKEKLTKEPRCSECKVKFRDPKPFDLIMYLHAYSYEGPNWLYETPLPPWSDVSWTEG